MPKRKLDRGARSARIVRGARIFGGVVILLGLLQGAVALHFYSGTSAFVQSAKVADGAVVGLARQGNSQAYYPVVSFVDDRGQGHEVRGALASTSPAYEPGETVRVYYDPENPSDAKINSFFSLWLWALLWSVFAATWISLGVLWLLLGPVVIRAVVKLVEGMRGQKQAERVGPQA